MSAVVRVGNCSINELVVPLFRGRKIIRLQNWSVAACRCGCGAAFAWAVTKLAPQLEVARHQPRRRPTRRSRRMRRPRQVRNSRLTSARPVCRCAVSNRLCPTRVRRRMKALAPALLVLIFRHLSRNQLSHRAKVGVSKRCFASTESRWKPSPPSSTNSVTSTPSCGPSISRHRHHC